MVIFSSEWIIVHFVILISYTTSSPSIIEQKLSKQESEQPYFVPCSSDESNEIRKILESTKCTECEEKKEKNLTQQEIKLLQAYLVKSKILEGLNMKMEPCPKMPKPPPQAIQAIINALDNDTFVDDNFDADETKTMTTRTESVAVFPKNEKSYKCGLKASQLCKRLDYYLPNRMETKKLLSLELWIPKPWQSSRNESIQTFAISNLRNQGCKCELELQPLDEGHHQNGPEDFDEWWKFQLGFRNCSNQLQELNTIAAELKGLSANVESDIGPFLLIRTMVEDKRFPTRNRRSALCVEGSKTCCRQPFYLNFTELNMDRWILHPSGYSAYSCTGDCLSDITSSRDHYTTLLMDYIREHPSMAKSLGLSVCCVPSVTSPLSIVYRDDYGNIYPTKSIPGMIVEGCVCA